ncbi:ABC transporter ATP-binding protein [Halorarum salinum]|uniref:Molybdate/tungstate import ATP-binding protein WtpC n=1 Tax=Halorarum salinum TaxID=2743089 RepID=A0A7D5QG92_9EURY|nr:ABC transporter ATP-binding protein [Halobaculum salinum]QLG63881.1 ABC transporter ATP-binding protein [Halobaculum salinum]
MSGDSNSGTASGTNAASATKTTGDASSTTGSTAESVETVGTREWPGADGTETPEGAGREPILELDGAGKRFGDETVVEDLSLSVREGEILTLLGPSGCGKTTTLRLVAGLEWLDAGEVRIGGDVVAGNGTFREPENRGVGVVFQEFALFPHLTAAENVGFGLQDRSDAERERRVTELLALVGLADQRDSHPDELSGGQQQRVALARSLAPEPDVLLLDEPFSNLDVDLRVRMREEVRSILKGAGVTAVSVTHDQEEAMSMSDRVAVMNDGRIEQVGRPERVFQHPESRFVAGFLGHASFLGGTVREGAVELGIGDVPADRIHGLAPEYGGSDVEVLVRPDDLRAEPVDGEGNGSGPPGHGAVAARRYLGPTVLYEVALDTGEHVTCMHNHDVRLERGRRVALSLVADHDLSWFPEGAETVVDG